MLQNLTDAKILIIDDEWANVHLLERTLRQAGYVNVSSTTDSRQALDLYKDLQPDLVLLDLMMPFLDGFGVIRQFCEEIEPGDYVPILVLTADITTSTKQKALSSGARDFLAKPLDLLEVLLRIRNLLETRLLHLSIRIQNQQLDQKVLDRTRELEESRMEILERLVIAGEYRDHDTGEHTQRVGTVAAALAEGAGASPANVQLIRLAAPLHDIGKIGIPDEVLLKSGKLTSAEFELMKSHTHIGAKILAGSRSPLLRMSASIALTHHEWWDGTGYPAGLAGNAIPFEGRVVAIADAFDALTHQRSYKGAWPLQEAISWMQQRSGSQFDPNLIDVFVQLTGSSHLLALAEAIYSGNAKKPDLAGLHQT